MSSSITFASLRFYVADIRAMFNNHQNPNPLIENLVFISYLPNTVTTSLELVAYAQTRDANGNLQYTGMPFPLTQDPTITPFSTSIAVMLPANFISAEQILNLIKPTDSDGDYLSVTPGIIPYTNFINYTISRTSIEGDDNQQQTNPSPPATMN